MIGLGMKTLWVAALAAALGCGAVRPAVAAEPADPWPELRATSSTDARLPMAPV